MYRISEIKDLLRKYDYVPLVRKAGDGVIFRLPHPKLACPSDDRLTEAYSIRRGREAGLYYNDTRYPGEKFVSVPEHAIRLFLAANISARCGRVPISEELVCYVDEGDQDHSRIEEIVDPPSAEEEVTKEGFLRHLVLQGVEDGFPPELEDVALTHGVHEGYRLIRSFYGVSKK